MPTTFFSRAIAMVVAVVLASVSLPVPAADGDPLAIRRWPGGEVSVETHWGLRLIVSPGSRGGSDSDRPDVKQVSFRSGIDHVFSRKPNDAAASWGSAKGENTAPGSIRVMSMFELDEDRAYGLFVQVDGVRIVFPSSDWDNALAAPTGEAGDLFDVVVMPERGELPPVKSLVDWIRKLEPRFVILPAKADPNQIEQFADQIGSSEKVMTVDHNTFAVSKAPQHEHQTLLVRLATSPFELPSELETLFAQMEASCNASQKVFSKLTVDQLNFRPSNGTHTPRWNAEHMMGRQLLFFSQIYHALDPSIPVMDLNPKQMPPDYVAAHPDWDGKEEARQMKRVSEFTRRFAYLLRDVNLDRQAPGSRWTLRGLLRQMDRHYQDHTNNTKQKFELADWPAQ